MRLRADSLAARTTTVHCGSSDNLNGLSKYTTALSRVSLHRGLKSAYIPGHCFFSSISLASPFLAGQSHIEGARIARLIIGRVYRNEKYHGNLRNWLSPDNARIWPGHENDSYSPPGVPLSVEDDKWHRPFLLDRAESMETADVEHTSSSLWLYSLLVDQAAWVCSNIFFQSIIHSSVTLTCPRSLEAPALCA